MKNHVAVRHTLLLLSIVTMLLAILPGYALAQSSINWNNAIQYANLVNIAENVPPANDYTDAVKRQITDQGYAYLQTIYGSDLGTDISPDMGSTVSYGFLAQSSEGELVAAIRGTDTILEWIDDAEFLFVGDPVPHGGGFTEYGFSTIYQSLRLAKSPSSQTVISSMRGYINAGTAKSVTVTGHSLGGALATLLALDVARNTTQKSPVLYTYASPRVGEEFFASDFNNAVPTSYRIYNDQDVVPDVPLWPYTSIKTPFVLVPDSREVAYSIGCEHYLTTYLFLMGKLAGVNAGSLESDCVATN